MKKVKLVTKESLTAMLAAASVEKKKQIVGRALVAILRYQTPAEKITHNTTMRNNFGFTAKDAAYGTLAANAFANNAMTLSQLHSWLRPLNGAPRITKYHRQLNIIALENKIIKLSMVPGNGEEIRKLMDSLPKGHHHKFNRFTN